MSSSRKATPSSGYADKAKQANAATTCALPHPVAKANEHAKAQLDRARPPRTPTSRPTTTRGRGR